MLKCSYHVFVLVTAQFKNKYARLAQNNGKEVRRSPRQSHFLLQLPECTPVEVTVCVVQVVTGRHGVRIKNKCKNIFIASGKTASCPTYRSY